MNGEINRDWYCVCGASFDECPKQNFMRTNDISCSRCSHRYRKYPTPEQYREKYGRGYPDDGAVYFQLKDRKGFGITLFKEVKSGKYFYWKKYIEVASIVCACTPWGKPPDNWRPA